MTPTQLESAKKTEASNELERMYQEARLALDSGNPREFRLSETAKRVAIEAGLTPESVRNHFLAAAYTSFVKQVERTATTF